MVEKEIRSPKEPAQSLEKITLSNKIFVKIRECLDKGGLKQKSRGLERQDIFIPSIVAEEETLRELRLPDKSKGQFVIFVKNRGESIINTDITASIEHTEEELGEGEADIAVLNLDFKNLFPKGHRMSNVKLQYLGGIYPCTFETQRAMGRESVYLGELTADEEYVWLVVDRSDGIPGIFSLLLPNNWRLGFGEDGKVIPPESGEKRVESKTTIASLVGSEEQLEDSELKLRNDFLKRVKTNFSGLGFKNSEELEFSDILAPKTVVSSDFLTEAILNNMGMRDGFPVFFIGEKGQKIGEEIVNLSVKKTGRESEHKYLLVSLDKLLSNNNYNKFGVVIKKVGSEYYFGELLSGSNAFPLKYSGRNHEEGGLLIVIRDGQRRMAGLPLPKGWEKLVDENGRLKGIEEKQDKAGPMTKEQAIANDLGGKLKEFDGAFKKLSKTLLTSPPEEQAQEKGVEDSPVLTREMKSLAKKIKEKPKEAFKEIADKVKTCPYYSGPAVKKKETREARLEEKNSRVYIVPSSEEIAIEIRGLDGDKLQSLCFAKKFTIDALADCFGERSGENVLALGVSLGQNNQIKITGQVLRYDFTKRGNVSALPYLNLTYREQELNSLLNSPSTLAYFISQLKPSENKSGYSQSGPFPWWLIDSDNNASSRRERETPQFEHPRYNPFDRLKSETPTPKTDAKKSKPVKGANRTGAKVNLTLQSPFLRNRIRTSKLPRK